MDGVQQNKRWYDKQPQVKQSIELLAAFPDEMLTVMAEGVNSVIEREYKVQELIRSFKSLGQEKVLALYKSKNKLRKLDQNPMMHKTVNYLFVISEENKLSVASQVLDFVNIVSDYLRLAKASGHQATLENIKALRDAYVAAGSVRAKTTLENIRQDMAKGMISERVNPKPPVLPPTATPSKIINVQDDEGGMRINFNSF